MKNKTLSLNLYSNLLTCDFIILRQNSLRLSASTSKAAKLYQHYSILDVIEIVKSLKTFYCFYRLLSKLKGPKESAVQILDNVSLEILAKALYTPEKKYFHTSNRFTKFNKQQLSKTKLFITLGEYNRHSLRRSTIMRAMFNNIHVIMNFNMKTEYSRTGLYHTPTELGNIKKSLLFAILFKKLNLLLNDRKRNISL